MKYRPYKLGMELMVRSGEKAKVIQRKTKKRTVSSLLESMGYLYEQYPEINQAIEPLLQSEEYKWLSSDRPVYFLESDELVKNLSEGAYNIKDPTVLFDGHETFMLALPGSQGNLSIKGTTGLLVTLGRHPEDSQERLNDFYDAMGRPRVTCVAEPFGEFGIMVNYMTGEEGIYTRASIPSDWIVDILNSESPVKFHQFMKKNNHFNYQMATDLTVEETHFEYDILKLVCGFLVYRKALPNRIVKGYPSETKDATTTLVKSVNGQFVTGGEGSGDTRTSHYRSWHFRQLMDKRYYQGEHKSKPIGSRLVFVKDSYVGLEVDANTVLEEV